MAKKNSEPRKAFHEELAEKIIKMLEDGTAPWVKPWEPGEIELPYNPVSGTRYRGANIVALYGESDPRWMTFKQAKAKGWNVKKGERSTRIQYWKFTEERQKKDAKGKVIKVDGKPVLEKVKLDRPKVFHSAVFNARQIEGIPELPPKDLTGYQWSEEPKAEALLKASGAKIEHVSGDRAFYSLLKDKIVLPEKEQFSAPHKYYETAFHELGHWTGHPSRLDRDMSGNKGSMSYAKEELRAEISSFITGAELDIGHDPGQHVSYIASWIKALREDPMEIVRATRDAEKISKFILGREFEQEKILAAGKSKNAPEWTDDKADLKNFDGFEISPVAHYQDFSERIESSAEMKAAKADPAVESIGWSVYGHIKEELRSSLGCCQCVADRKSEAEAQAVADRLEGERTKPTPAARSRVAAMAKRESSREGLTR